MTYNYFKYYKQYVKAVFRMDADSFFTLVENRGLPEGILEDCGVFSDVPLPLHYITICWDIIIREVYSDINERDYPKEYANKTGNDRLKEYFATRHNLEMESIPFRDYGKYFYISCYPFEDFRPEDIMFEPRGKLLKAGCRKKDIELYYYADTFDFDKVESLLKEGADSNYTFEGDNQCIGRIGAEAAFLSTMIDLGDICEGSLLDFDEKMGLLIGYAAHEKMYGLLQRYCQSTG